MGFPRLPSKAGAATRASGRERLIQGNHVVHDSGRQQGLIAQDEQVGVGGLMRRLDPCDHARALSLGVAGVVLEAHVQAPHGLSHHRLLMARHEDDL